MQKEGKNTVSGYSPIAKGKMNNELFDLIEEEPYRCPTCGKWVTEGKCSRCGNTCVDDDYNNLGIITDLVEYTLINYSPGMAEDVRIATVELFLSLKSYRI